MIYISIRIKSGMACVVVGLLPVIIPAYGESCCFFLDDEIGASCCGGGRIHVDPNIDV